MIANRGIPQSQIALGNQDSRPIFRFKNSTLKTTSKHFCLYWYPKSNTQRLYSLAKIHKQDDIYGGITPAFLHPFSLKLWGTNQWDTFAPILSVNLKIFAVDRNDGILGKKLAHSNQTEICKIGTTISVSPAELIDMS